MPGEQQKQQKCMLCVPVSDLMMFDPLLVGHTMQIYTPTVSPELPQLRACAWQGQWQRQP